MTSAFARKYGPWALVAGASEGIGRAFSLHLARRGLNLLLLARRDGPLQTAAAEITALHRVRVECHALDLGGPDVTGRLEAIVADREVGMLVYNAAASHVGDFLSTNLQAHLQEVDVNCRGPLTLTHALAAPMAARGRGGIVLLSSITGNQGSALVSSYAATKAFNTVLAEGLWEEFGHLGVDVLGCIAGMTRTPNFEASRPREGSLPMAPMEPAQVAEEALAALGKQPTLIPGRFNRLSSGLMRLLPRARAVRILSAATRKMYGPERSTP